MFIIRFIFYGVNFKHPFDNAISIWRIYHLHKKVGVFMIADRIKMLRTAQNISQAELAKRLEITRSSVNAWEQGFSIPSTGYIVELARLFHVSTDYLLGLNQNTSLDLSGLDTEQVRILQELAEHFRKEKQGK